MAKFLYFLSLYFGFFNLARSASPLALDWSSGSFGPDGPWQAVTVKLGSTQQSLNLYPGGEFSSFILNTTQCTSNYGTCYAKSAGSIWNSSMSTSLVSGKVSFLSGADFSGEVLDISGTSAPSDSTQSLFSSDELQINGNSVPDFDITLWSTLKAHLPDGTAYPIEMGTLSLGGGANAVNQTFDRSSIDESPYNQTLMTGWLWSESVIPSNSWGMHIGSVQNSISPSLYLGGYDQSRVISPVTTQSGGPGSIDLLDVAINVIDGASPFKANFTSLSGLLASGNSTITREGFVPTNVNPLSPYISLPKSSCDAIAAQLPVTYQSKYGLYTWNVDDPLCKTIISSASVLSFTFRLNESNDQNVTISVPFLLLNLTLTAPLTSEDTAYFPCNPIIKSGISFTLGRAFLQAAFIGAHWNTNVWWLAQAPGPDISSSATVTTIKQTDDSITPSTNSWGKSWAKAWTVLADASSGTSTTSVPSSGGLSTGAKAGIGAGIGSVALVGLVALGTALRKYRRQKQSNKSNSDSLHPGVTQYHHPIGHGVQELDGKVLDGQIPASGNVGGDAVHEAPDAQSPTSLGRQELMGSQVAPGWV